MSIIYRIIMCLILCAKKKKKGCKIAWFILLYSLKLDRNVGNINIVHSSLGNRIVEHPFYFFFSRYKRPIASKRKRHEEILLFLAPL